MNAICTAEKTATFLNTNNSVAKHTEQQTEVDPSYSTIYSLHICKGSYTEFPVYPIQALKQIAYLRTYG